MLNEDLEIAIQSSGVATITLNRAERHNAFDDELLAKLIAALNQLDQNSAVRVLVLRASGKSFSSGADLQWMKRMAQFTLEENLQDAHLLATVMKTLYQFSKPTLALVHGPAYGGGAGLIACCDIAIATSNARFCFSEVKLGLIPAVISPYVINAIGPRAASRYFLTAELFNAQEAERIGLIHQTVNPEELDTMANTLITALLNNGPEAVKAAKRLIHHVQNQPITAELINYTANAIAQIRVSTEGQTGLQAFLDKQSPPWVAVTGKDA